MSKAAVLGIPPGRIACAFSLLFLFVTMDASAQPGAPPLPNAPPLSGVAIGDDGKPIHAVITAIKASLPVGGGRVETASDGSFAMSGLPDGKYQLCAVDKGGNYLDPCTWSNSPVTVTISAAKPISGYRLVLTKGVPLQVRVNDAGQILSAPAALNQPPATLTVSIMTLRHTMQHLPTISKDSGGRTFQSVVPINASIQVKLFGQGLTLADASGKALNISLGASIPVQTSGAQQALSFTVTGAVTGTGTKP